MLKAKATAIAATRFLIVIVLAWFSVFVERATFIVIETLAWTLSVLETSVRFLAIVKTSAGFPVVTEVLAWTLFVLRSDALFEFAVLLEFSLSHIATVLLRLDIATACSHVVEPAGEYLVFPQFALQRTVVKRYAP